MSSNQFYPDVSFQEYSGEKTRVYFFQFLNEDAIEFDFQNLEEGIILFLCFPRWKCKIVVNSKSEDKDKTSKDITALPLSPLPIGTTAAYNQKITLILPTLNWIYFSWNKQQWMVQYLQTNTNCLMYGLNKKKQVFLTESKEQH